MISTLIIVDSPKRWPLETPNVPVVSARDYLSDQRYAAMKRVRVVNICRSYRYQSAGYYVSLLAEARGHKPTPSVATIQDFKSQSIIKSMAFDLQDRIQNLLEPLQSDKFVLSIYFGRNLAKKYDRISQDLYNLFPAPLLRATFSRNSKIWQLQNISPIASSDLPENHRDFVIQVAQEFIRKKAARRKDVVGSRYDLAILVDPHEPMPPSDEAGLKLMEKAADALDIGTERITQEDYGRIAEFDALFIRATTAVNHYTYRFARKAQAEGLVVIDDPQSILRCTNKVFLQELLAKNKVPSPPTRILHRDNKTEVMEALGLPCILKQPDSSFSKGVVKVDSPEAFEKMSSELLEESELLIAQAFVPTEFDWRIGVLDGQPLFACCYFMAKGHWQIYNHSVRGKDSSGNSQSFALDNVPKPVMDAALKSACLIGDGLYGVDVKEYQDNVCVIEVNDNPNLDAGVEDLILGNELYIRIMQSFLRRLERRHQARPLMTNPRLFS
jgi:glutathione synthase/RimK-type ligase-like ATP-grasp enzyme